MTHKILVYGTLRPGNSPVVFVPGLMYDIGAFPGVRLCECGVVACEVIEVDDQGLARLDMYEGYREDSPETSLYIRQRVDTDGLSAYIYEFNSDMSDKTPMDNADWLAYRQAKQGSAAHLGNNARSAI